MPRLQTANNAETTLNAGITSAQTSFTVTDSSLFPDNAPFKITIDAEIMEVGAINKFTHTFSSVIRGNEGTTAASHSSGASVQNRWTSGTHGELADDEDLTAHTGNTGNPHNVTAAQVNAFNLNGDTIVGDTVIDTGNTTERKLRWAFANGTDLIGFFGNPTSNNFGLYDWGNARNVWAVERTANRVRHDIELAFNKTLSTANRLIDLQQSFGLYSDNTGGTANARLWFDGPNGAELWLGPRAGGSLFDKITLRGSTTIEKTGDAFKLVGTDHTYIEYYPLGIGGGRKAFVGHGTPSSTVFTINNTNTINIRPSGGTRDFSFAEDATNGTLTYGTFSALKFISGELQCRNNTDTGYIPIRASSFPVGSDRSFKTGITNCECDALELIESTPVYNYKLIDEVERDGENAKTRTGLIVDESPQQIVQDEEAIDLYSMTSFLWKAIQQLSAKVTQLEGGS